MSAYAMTLVPARRQFVIQAGLVARSLLDTHAATGALRRRWALR